MSRLLYFLVFIETKILADSTGNLSTKELATRFLDETERPLWSWNKSWTEINSWQAFSDWSSNIPSWPSGTVPLHFLDYGVHVVSIYPKRIGGNQVTPRQEMIILGGVQANLAPRRLDEVWIYLPDINAWRMVKTRPNPPTRYSATIVTICSKYLILIGGENESTLLHDVWIFDSQQQLWLEVVQIDEKLSPFFESTKSPEVTAIQLADSNTSCRCKESVLFLPKSSWKFTWQLTCINETKVYRWQRLAFNWKEDIHPINMMSDSEVASSPPTKIHLLDFMGLWQYTTEKNTWELLGIDPIGIATLYVTKNGKSILTADHYIRFDIIAKSAYVYSFTDKRWVIKVHLGGIDFTLNPSPFVCNNRIFLVAIGDSSPNVAIGDSSPIVIMELKVEDVWTWHTIRDPEVSPPKIGPKQLGVFAIADVHMISGHIYFVLSSHHIIQEFWKLNLDDMKWVKQALFHNLSFTNIATAHAATILGSTGFVVCESQYIRGILVPVLRVSSYSTHARQWIRYGCAQKLTEQPVVRYSTSVVSLNASSLLLFAGKQYEKFYGRKKFVKPKLLNDTWILSMPNPDSNSRFVRWTLVNNYVPPLARERHSMVFIQNQVFLYGGADQHGQCINDLWKFNITTAQWSQIVTIGRGPEPSPATLCYSTAAAVGGHMIIVIRCPNEVKADCSPVGLQIWMFITQSARWTFLSHNEVYGRDWSYFVFHWRSRLVIFDTSKINLLISLLGCPPGFQSTNISDVHTPCEQCPYGSYSHKGQFHCQDCPNGVTTLEPGATGITQCSVCTDGYCQYGWCVIIQVERIPQPSCQCSFGFTGSLCQYPTYYLVMLGVIIFTALAVVGITVPYRLWKKKRQREEALDNHVRQFNSVWQIKQDEIVMRDRVGKGGYGEVYQAEYRDMTVAMKILSLPADESMQDDFEREVKFMQTIRHPNIVMFIGAGRLQADGSPFIIAEFMHRGSVRDLLDDHSQQLNLQTIKRIAVDVANGMNFLHSLLPPRIHCDLKSDNLLISQSWVVKVADFGLGRQLIAQRNTTSRKISNRRRRMRCDTLSLLLIQVGDEFSQMAVGAARWRAPEISRHDLEQLNTSADIYR